MSEREREGGGGGYKYLSVSDGTIRTTSFGINLRALFKNWFTRLASTPKGGFSPIIYIKSIQIYIHQFYNFREFKTKGDKQNLTN